MGTEYIWEIKVKNTPALKKNVIIATVTDFIAATNSV